MRSRDIQRQEFNRFFSEQILELGFAEELNHISDAKYENHKKKLRPGDFDQNKGRQAAHVTLVNPLDKNPDPEVQASQTLQVSPRRDLRCGRGRRAQEEPQVLPNAPDCVISFDTITKRITSRRSSTSGTEQILEPGFAVVIRIEASHGARKHNM